MSGLLRAPKTELDLGGTQFRETELLAHPRIVATQDGRVYLSRGELAYVRGVNDPSVTDWHSASPSSWTSHGSSRAQSPAMAGVASRVSRVIATPRVKDRRAL